LVSLPRNAASEQSEKAAREQAEMFLLIRHDRHNDFGSGTAPSRALQLPMITQISPAFILLAQGGPGLPAGLVVALLQAGWTTQDNRDSTFRPRSGQLSLGMENSLNLDNPG
jgi:hypothetical protein